MHTLILLRHGESEWNSENRFTGWVDVGLTPHGEEQARDAGRLLRAAGLAPAAAHTSVLTRAVRTCSLALAAAGSPAAPVARSWRLNERHYGALQGQDKKAVRLRHGDARFRSWRRSWDAVPPPVEPGAPHDPAADPRYAGEDRALLPRAESLADVTARLLPYWRDAVVPDLRRGRPVLVVAHSNSLRALVAHLDGVRGAELLALHVPTAVPLVYELDARLAPSARGGRYLDPRAAERGAAEVAGQGL